MFDDRGLQVPRGLLGRLPGIEQGILPEDEELSKD